MAYVFIQLIIFKKSTSGFIFLVPLMGQTLCQHLQMSHLTLSTSLKGILQVNKSETQRG